MVAEASAGPVKGSVQLSSVTKKFGGFKAVDDIDPAMLDPHARLAFLDREGIDAQVLYPNVGGFGNGYFLRLAAR